MTVWHDQPPLTRREAREQAAAASGETPTGADPPTSQRPPTRRDAAASGGRMLWTPSAGDSDLPQDDTSGDHPAARDREGRADGRRVAAQPLLAAPPAEPQPVAVPEGAALQVTAPRIQESVQASASPQPGDPVSGDTALLAPAPLQQSMLPQQSQSPEFRATEARAAATLAAESVLTETRAAVARAAEARAAEARAAEARATELRIAESRAAEGRAAKTQAADIRAAEERAAQRRIVESRAEESRAAEAWAADARVADRSRAAAELRAASDEKEVSARAAEESLAAEHARQKRENLARAEAAATVLPAPAGTVSAAADVAHSPDSGVVGAGNSRRREGAAIPVGGGSSAGDTTVSGAIVTGVPVTRRELRAQREREEAQALASRATVGGADVLASQGEEISKSAFTSRSDAPVEPVPGRTIPESFFPPPPSPAQVPPSSRLIPGERSSAPPPVFDIIVQPSTEKPPFKWSITPGGAESETASETDGGAEEISGLGIFGTDSDDSDASTTSDRGNEVDAGPERIDPVARAADVPPVMPQRGLNPFDALFSPPATTSRDRIDNPRPDLLESGEPLLPPQSALNGGLPAIPDAEVDSAGRPFGHWSTQGAIDEASQTNDHLLSRNVALTTGAITTHALVLPSTPDSGQQSHTLITGEVLVTGSIDLPRSFGSTGAHPALFDHPDVDALIDASDREDAASESAPVRAIRAVSSNTSTRGVIEAPARAKSRLPLILGIIGGAVLLVVGTALIVSVILNAF